MSSDTQYTALGPTTIGFQTSGTNILMGVDAGGNNVGVAGRGPLGVLGDGVSTGVQGKGRDFGVIGEGETGVEGKGTAEGVHGEGKIGVVGRGDTGIRGDGANGPGVSGRAVGLNPGVDGRSSGGPGVAATGATGVYATGTDGAGVHAISNAKQAAFLQSIRMAQLHLFPLEIPNPTSLQRADAGDLLATVGSDERGVRVASLWFCKVGGDPTQANWVKVA